MSEFARAIDTLLKHEGGYVFDMDDPGGETKYGISKRTYPYLDIVNLTEEDAKRIYKQDWWDKYLYSLINNQKIATKVFDLAVNMGAKQSHKLLQRAVNATGGDLVDDGVIGQKTREAVNLASPEAVLAALRSESAGYYRVLIAKNPINEKYEKGWLKRAYS